MKNRESVESKALEYLSEKYNESFEAVDSVRSGMDVPYDVVFLHSTKFPNDVITVYIENDGGKTIFSDNYFGIIKKDEYAKMLENDVNTVFPNSKIYFTFVADFFDESYIASTDLSQVMEDDKYAMDSNIKIFVSSEHVAKAEYEKKCEELFTILKEKNYLSMVQICCIEHSLFDTLDEANYVDILKENYDSVMIIDGIVK